MENRGWKKEKREERREGDGRGGDGSRGEKEIFQGVRFWFIGVEYEEEYGSREDEEVKFI